MKVLVTGAAGFIGSTLCEALLARGDEVVAIDNFNDYYSPLRKRANVEPMLDHDRFTLCEGDFSDREWVMKVIADEQPQAIAHLGAMGSVRYSVLNPSLYIRVNIVGTANILEGAQAAGVKQVVFASTSSVYGQTTKVPFVETDRTDFPLAPYPASKKACEVLGHAYYNMHGMNFTALRFFNVYGPKGRPDMMPYIILERLLKDEEITWFDGGTMRRDWTYVGDIIKGVIEAIDKPLGYEVLNIGRGEPVVMTEFLEILEEMVGRKARLKVVPAPVSEPKITFAKVDKLKNLLGYEPTTPVRDGLSLFLDWYQKVI